MELLYGGTARRIGYEGGRAQNRARIEPGALGMTIVQSRKSLHLWLAGLRVR